LRFSKTFGLNEKAKFSALYFWLVFFASSFFVLKNNWNIFIIIHALPKRLINFGHDFQKILMTMKISHGGICIFTMGVILLCNPMVYV
jgi:hypothetical protein